jgi:hypothetical protein
MKSETSEQISVIPCGTTGWFRFYFHQSCIQLFPFWQKLTMLYLDGNKIGDNGTQHLAVCLRNNTVIIVLSLSLSISVVSIFFSLYRCSWHLALDPIKSETSEHNISVMPWDTIRWLWFYFHQSCIRLFPFLQKLTTLYLDRNKVGDSGAQHLADGLRNNMVIMIVLVSDKLLFPLFFL